LHYFLTKEIVRFRNYLKNKRERGYDMVVYFVCPMCRRINGCMVLGRKIDCYWCGIFDCKDRERKITEKERTEIMIKKRECREERAMST